MAIPENQLEIWSNPASQAKFKDAHESIRKSLDRYDWPSGRRDFDIYLQGSYKNSTSTRKNSDVDLVVQLNSSFRYDLSTLSDYEKELYNRYHSDATYLWEHFRNDILSALKQNESYKINIGNKCINIETPYLSADVVVCLQYRLYNRYRGPQDEEYIEGITFKPHNEERWIINYPKQHTKNGEAKSKNTDGWYKKTVRMFKNTKSYLVEHNMISKNQVPSYFVECLLYNIPDSKFGKNFGQIYYNVLNYLYYADLNNFKCQNEVVDLFGDSPEQWSIDDAKTFINKTINLWNNWGK